MCVFLLDPVFHSVGYVLLRDLDVLSGFWTFLFNLPIFPLTRFNNTVVLGCFVFSLVACSTSIFSLEDGCTSL